MDPSPMDDLDALFLQKMASSNRRLLLSYTPPVLANPGPPLGGDYAYSPAPRKNQIPYRWEIAGLVIGGLLSLAVLSMLVARYFLKRRSGNSSRTRNPRDNPPILFDIQEDFADEDHGPELDHPIWHIRTVGLDRSIIDSIAVFKYRAGEGVTEGTDCSVCLNEFREDESLKLLPKCSHAFHVPCIDTWLQSHKNCPVCRAPIVRAGGTEQASLQEPSGANSSSNRSVIEENLDNRGISQSDSRRSLSRAGEVEANENRIEDGNFGSSQVEDGGKVMALPDLGECKVRVVSDLGDHCRVTGEEIQPVRRSVSVNSPSALEIYSAVAIAVQDQNQGTSRRQASRMMKSSSLRANKTRTCGNGSGSSGSSSLYRMVKSCSFGASLNEEPASMKRSYSSSGNVRALRQ